MFGLTNQLGRSASSVMANLAEGYGRHSKRELRRFAHIANGSLEEAKSFMILANDLGYLPDGPLEQLWEEAETTGRLIGGIERATAERN